MRWSKTGITAWLVAVAAIVVMYSAVATGAAKVQAGSELHPVTLSIAGRSCEEDEVLRGRGDFEDGVYSRYVCWNPGW